MVKVKRSLSISSSNESGQISSSSPPPSQGTPQTPPRPKKAKHEPVEKETQGFSPKARLATEAKRMLAEEIINRGVAAIDADQLARATGLTKQQIKSQLADNRQNIRKQLLELARSIV